MGGNRSYGYSLLGRFISLVILTFFSVAFCFIWKVEDTRSKLMDERLREIVYDVSKNISNDFYYIVRTEVAPF